MNKDVINIIHSMKNSMILHEINQQILNIKYKSFPSDDVYHFDKNHSMWDSANNIYVVTYNKKINIRSIFFNYTVYRNYKFKKTYICKDCGEYLKPDNPAIKLFNCKSYHCKCGHYIY